MVLERDCSLHSTLLFYLLKKAETITDENEFVCEEKCLFMLLHAVEPFKHAFNPSETN